MPSRSLTELFPVTASTVVDDRFVVRLLNTIELRFRALELLSPAVESGLQSLRQVGLDRINEVLTPAIKSILTVQEHGYLTAFAATGSAMDLGNTIIANIGDADERAVFVASKFVIFTRQGNHEDYAILVTTSYDNTTGDYIGQVVAQAGEKGPFDDWQINGVAGSTIAQQMMLASAMVARDATLGAAEAVEDARSEVAANRLGVANDKAAILAAVAAGPVIEVAGLNGIVSAEALRSALAISMSDVSGLAAALSGKADVDATLAALAGVATAADKLIYATGVDAFATTDLTAAGRALLDDDNAAEQRATLGLTSASASEFFAGADAVKPVTTETVAEAGELVPISSASTINIDCSTGLQFIVDPLNHNATVAEPTNVLPGKVYEVYFAQGSTGGTLSFSTAYKLSPTPTASTGVDKVDILSFRKRPSDGTLISRFSKGS